jgi:hypothetical protein
MNSLIDEGLKFLERQIFAQNTADPVSKVKVKKEQ